MLKRLLTTFWMFVVLQAGSDFTPAQSPAQPPVAKQPAAEKTELTETEFEERIIRTLGKPQAWKQYDFPGFDFSVDFPRDPVRQTESFYDESLGNVKMEMYVAVGDEGTYLVGMIPMPYAITEENLLREAYEAVIKEFADDPELKLRN